MACGRCHPGGLPMSAPAGPRAAAAAPALNARRAAAPGLPLHNRAACPSSALPIAAHCLRGPRRRRATPSAVMGCRMSHWLLGWLSALGTGPGSWEWSEPEVCSEKDPPRRVPSTSGAGAGNDPGCQQARAPGASPRIDMLFPGCQTVFPVPWMAGGAGDCATEFAAPGRKPFPVSEARGLTQCWAD